MTWWAWIGKITVTVVALTVVWSLFRGLEIMTGDVGDTGAKGLYGAIVKMEAGIVVLMLIWGWRS